MEEFDSDLSSGDDSLEEEMAALREFEREEAGMRSSSEEEDGSEDERSRQGQSSSRPPTRPSSTSPLMVFFPSFWFPIIFFIPSICIWTDIFNADGIQTKLDELALPEDFHWLETMAVVPGLRLEIPDINQDLAREVKFYELSLLGVKEAIGKLETLGVPYIRPPDFYADMVKPPAQMDRIKDALLRSQRRKEAVEERKRRRELMKYAKQLKTHKSKQKAQEKLEKFGKSPSGKDGGITKQNRELKVPRMEVPTGPAGRNQGNQGNPKNPQGSRKRKAKDAKYGFGGRKKFAKSNDQKSANDFSGFSLRKNNSRNFGKNAEAPATGRRRKKSSKPQRPGKARRAAMREQKNK